MVKSKEHGITKRRGLGIKKNKEEYRRTVLEKGNGNGGGNKIDLR